MPTERLLPRITIYHLIMLVTVSAIIAWAVRTGFQGNYSGLKAIVLLVCVTIACFVVYAAMFLLAYLFSILMQPLIAATGQSLQPKRDAVPTRDVPQSSVDDSPAPPESR